MHFLHLSLRKYGLSIKFGSSNNTYLLLSVSEYRLKKEKYEVSSTSGSSKISTAAVEKIIMRLKNQQNRTSTCKTYLRIWRQFNKFIINLDRKPALWEDKTTLFIGYLINKGTQSSSIKSYVSAIKRILVDDGYNWDDTKVLLSSLTKACRLINDRVHTRLPIQCGLLELILGEIRRYFMAKNQDYLEKLYLALISLGYYGLMRVGELTNTESNHALRACNVHIAQNKNKILLVLYTSKTHGLNNRPQKIKIEANNKEKSGHYKSRIFCPFQLLRNYLECRGSSYHSDTEQFFVFSDGEPVSAFHARELLTKMLTNLGLDPSVYGMHSLRVGRSTDLIKFNYSIDQLKILGRWRSNAVYKYVRNY